MTRRPDTHRVSKHVERRRSKAQRDQESRLAGSQKGCRLSGDANREPSPITLAPSFDEWRAQRRDRE